MQRDIFHFRRYVSSSSISGILFLNAANAFSLTQFSKSFGILWFKISLASCSNSSKVISGTSGSVTAKDIFSSICSTLSRTGNFGRISWISSASFISIHRLGRFLSVSSFSFDASFLQSVTNGSSVITAVRNWFSKRFFKSAALLKVWYNALFSTDFRYSFSFSNCVLSVSIGMSLSQK